MNSSAAISDAGPTVDDPSIRIEPDSASAAGSSGSAAQPARTRTDADIRAATEMNFFFNVFLLLGIWKWTKADCLPTSKDALIKIIEAK
jgi:hypothetical protein